MSLEIGEKMIVDGIEFIVHFVSREVYTTKLNDKPNKSKERLDIILWRDLNEESNSVAKEHISAGTERPETTEPKPIESPPPASSVL